jgi:hypothetical protein
MSPGTKGVFGIKRVRFVSGPGTPVNRPIAVPAAGEQADAPPLVVEALHVQFAENDTARLFALGQQHAVFIYQVVAGIDDVGRRLSLARVRI